MFIIGKILFFFLSPFVWLFILVILTATAKTEKKKKTTGWHCAGCIAFFLQPMVDQQPAISISCSSNAHGSE